MSWQRWSGIMKCYPFEEKRLAKWSPPFIVQPKYDGDRCKAYPLPHSNDFLCLTSEENPYFSIPHIKESLASSGLNLVLDGELYSHYLCIEGGHELVHSIASRTKNLHPRHKELEYHIFDVEVEKLQLERILILENIKKLNLPYIRVAPFWICETLDDIKRVYDNLVTQGYEGIIIRHAICPYERKRSTLMMKFKPKRSDTYNIVGWNEEVSQHGCVDQVGIFGMDTDPADLAGLREPCMLPCFTGVSAFINTAERAAFFEIPRDSAFIIGGCIDNVWIFWI